MLDLHVTPVVRWNQRGEPFPGAYLISADGHAWKEARWPLPSGPQYEVFRGIYLGNSRVAWVQDELRPIPEAAAEVT